MTATTGRPRSTTVAVGGGERVHVRVWRARQADPARPVLFALHGWTDSGEVFAPLASAVSQRWHVVAPDAPGHGGTPWRHTGRYDVSDHVRFARAALVALPRLLTLGTRPRPPVVVYGHSMGGLTAARLAAACAATPHAPAQLVLEDPAGTSGRRAPTSASGLAWIPPLHALSQTELDRRSRELNHGWPEAEHPVWAASLREFDPATLEVPLAWGPPLLDALAETRCPVTFVVGRTERGGIVTARSASACARACRAGAELTTLDVGHSPRRESPEIVTALVAGVLGRHEGALT
ncbi:MAG: alpha/beta fold hydrolase [Kineosporiaceae bacterium]